MDKYLKISFGLALVSLLLLTGEFVLSWQGLWSPNLRQVAQNLEQQLDELNQDYLKLVNDNELVESLVQDSFTSTYFQQLISRPYDVVVYKGEQEVVWSNNDVIPPPFLAKALAEGASFLRLSNGYYVIQKTTRVMGGEQVQVLGLVKIRNNFRIQNRYLENDFNPLLGLPNYVRMVLNREADSAPVNGVDGKTLFFLQLDNFEYSKVPHKGKDWLNLLIILLGVGAINAFCYYIVLRYNPWLGLILLAATLAGIRYLMIFYDLPYEFTKLELFDPKFYASSAINKSLGDLLLNILVIFNVVYYLFMFMPFSRTNFKAKAGKYVIISLMYISLYFLAYVVGWTFNSLLLNSNIPFDLNNFMDLTSFSLLGLIGLSVVLLSFYMLVLRAIRYMMLLEADQVMHNVIIIIAASTSILMLLFEGSGLLEVFTALWAMMFIFYIKRQVQRGMEISSFANLIFLVILFAVFSSVHMYSYNQAKELEYKKSVSRKIADQRDRIVEYLFLDIQERVFQDQFIKNYFLTPFISTKDIVRRIRTLYFGGYFNKYDINIYTIDKQGSLIQSEEDDFMDLLDENAELSPPSDYLYFIPKTGGSYAYICNMPILYRNKFIGTVIIELNPKSYNRTHLYPELLLEENVRPIEDDDVYSYAVYIDNIMINKEGSYAYNYQFSFQDTITEEYDVYQVDGLTHLLYRPNDKKRVVVTSRADTILQPVTLFSYLFCVFLLFTLLIGIVRILFRFIWDDYAIRDLFNITFRDKIQYSMIAILVFAFLVIGYATVLHFRSEYNTYHLDRLIRKEMAIKSSIEYIVRGNEKLLTTPALTDDEGYVSNKLDLSSLSDIHAMDINIYNLQGVLSRTSQPDIFEKGLKSTFIDPRAFEMLSVQKKSQYMQNELIGNLDYLSIYVPLRDNHGKLLAYMNLPYFAKQKELQGEISAFLVALVNVYVFLLVIGGVIAYILSNSITASLTAISQKLKFTQLGRKNEPIEWRSDDEIGQLVHEYNKMIVELEQSADLLARSERESAWREMAKQIAHEIKNPLTPMKLSIQHLQRAIAENRPNVNEMAKKVAATLVEQIENLTHIASEFSSFAKMPTAQNEVFGLDEVVGSVADLFNEDRVVNIKFLKPEEPVWVYADKNQVLRVFNNLVKNAVQAIPSDRKGRVLISFNLQPNFTIVSISDNGIGIPEDQKGKVFVPNFTTKTSGTGLGLAISRQIIENAGGEIWFESKEEIGTTFFVRMPLHKGRR